jgi:uncharacterized protein (TIGR02646 family)
MKYIKKETPPAYKKWFDENNDRWQNSDLDEEEIFNKITAKLKKTLNKHLLIEQGYICAYCGKRIGKIPPIGEGLTFSVDHFESKHCNRSLVLAYHNLLGSCKMSQEKSEKVNLSTIKSTPKTFKNIALELGIKTDDFTGKGRIKEDDDLVALNISEVKYRKTSLHCDDVKEDGLIKKMGWQGNSESVERYIINPTTSVDCETYFEYAIDDTGGLCIMKAKDNIPNTQRAKNTIAVFELNNEYLCKARTDARKRVQTLRKSQELGLDNDDIINEIYSLDNDGKLAPFCFVTAYFLV